METSKKPACFKSLPDMVQPILGQIDFGLKWCSPFWDKLILAWNGVAHSGTKSFCPKMGYPIPGQTQFVPEWAAPFQAKLRKYQRGLRKTVLFGVVPCLFLCSIDRGPPHAYRKQFLQKEPVQQTLSGRRSTIYKVPPHIGGHHFLLCQQTNIKDIAGQSARSCLV